MFLETEENVAFGGAAERMAASLFKEAEYGMDSDDIYDCEDAVSVVSCCGDVGNDDEETDPIELAQELVWTTSSEHDERLEQIRMQMKDILEEACDNGQLAMMLTKLREARTADYPLPRASSLAPCTRPTFARCLQPRSNEGAPVAEENFPLDCLPPSTPVASASAPTFEENKACFEKIEEHEGLCRAIASSNLQFLYREASRTLAAETPAAPEVASLPAPLCSSSKPSSVEAAIEQARAVLFTATASGELGKAIDEVMEKREAAAAQEQNMFERVRNKMRFTLCNAMEDGRLQGALQDLTFEKACAKARSVLSEAAVTGKLEAAVKEAMAPRQVAAKPINIAQIKTGICAKLVEAVSSGQLTKALAEVLGGPQPGAATKEFFKGLPSTTPSAPAKGSPQRPQLAGSRTVITTPETSSEVQPVPPSEPRSSATQSCSSPRKARFFGAAVTPVAPASKPTGRPTARPSTRDSPQKSAAPVPPQSPAPGVRRPARASTFTGANDQSKTQATSSAPGPLRPASARRAASQVCLSARGTGPTALELDLGCAAGSFTAATTKGATSQVFDMDALERLRASKVAALQGTGLLPKLPSNSAGSAGWSLGLEHNMIQQKSAMTAQIRASSTF
jgi:hypothetical protein